jgi:hypothetical protein
MKAKMQNLSWVAPCPPAITWPVACDGRAVVTVAVGPLMHWTAVQPAVFRAGLAREIQRIPQRR